MRCWLRSLALILSVAVAGLALAACSSTPAAATTISGLALTGTVPAIGSTSQYTSTVTYSDNTTHDVTTMATWVSFNTAVATVSSTGVVTAIAPGTSVLKAIYQGSAGTADLTVTQ